MEPILDFPAWTALTTHHTSFAEGDPQKALRYRPGILPFIACTPAANAAAVNPAANAAPSAPTPQNALETLDPYLTQGEAFYLIGQLPPLPASWTLEFQLPCAQMLLPATAPIQPPIHNIEPLGEADAQEMYDLITSIQPGYYAKETHRLGTYYGIRHQNRLVAMAGERMRLPGFTELSAICTAPAYTGLGYAQSLIAHLCLRHRAQNITPFLHVALSNERAIKLYEHLGFQHRREITFHRCRKA